MIRMICRECGKELKSDAKFCPYCGTPADINAADSGFAKGQDGFIKRRKRLPYLITAAFAVIIIAAAGMIAYSQTPVQRLKRQISLGERYLTELNYEQAVANFTEAIRIDPQNPDAHIGLGHAYEGMGRVFAAVAGTETDGESGKYLQLALDEYRTAMELTENSTNIVTLSEQIVSVEEIFLQQAEGSISDIRQRKDEEESEQKKEKGEVVAFEKMAENGAEENRTDEASAISERNLFDLLPEEFVFSSGAGAWATEIHINNDGTFTGEYLDSDMGDVGPGYPGGTAYICNFNGKFSEPGKQDAHIYAMRLEYITTEETEGKTYIENEIRYICSSPYGFDDADEFMIYLPGAELSRLPEEFLMWAFLAPEIRNTMPAGVYGIYNVNGEEGFVGYEENLFWYSSYRYEYGETYSNLWPSFSGWSHLIFWPDSDSPATLDLTFAWSEDEQTEFLAKREFSDEEYSYKILIHLKKDKSTADIRVESLYREDLSMYGGTADGVLQAEYIREKER